MPAFAGFFMCGFGTPVHGEFVVIMNKYTSSMVGWAGQPSGWPCRWCGSLNPVQSITRRLRPLSGGKQS
ncbi:ash family protein [Vibrio fluvialis]|nr:ash family protein [Vibrio fluvialis]ELG2043595.1 ash family protein [Vibrio fluvialis]ELK3677600.1 ash family protein [Vibrio fluvialis]ELL0573960.1 ash family protein [Vibrio fluvialis]ELO1779736.1 ash family protein [Vibrio fluvialis]